MAKKFRRIRSKLVQKMLSVASRICPRATGRYLARRFVTPDPVSRKNALAAASHYPEGMHQGEMEIDGVRLVTYMIEDPAKKPYVLIAHGWSSYGLRLASWIEPLRDRGYAVVSFDQRGHGLSKGKTCCMPDFVTAIGHIGRHFGPPAVYIGHSMGAASIPFAVKKDWCPERFVLLAPMVVPGEIARRRFANAGLSPRTFEPFEDWLFERLGSRFADYDSRVRLLKIAAPALIIHDRQDRETPWEDGLLWSRLWPQSRLITTEGLGHNRILDDPIVIAEAMEFIGVASFGPDSHRP